jgi:hypothetical protein
MANLLNKPQSPALPETSAIGYNNVLRLFFNRITAVLVTLTEPDVAGGGGRFIYKPHGAFFSDVTQTFVATNVAQPLTFTDTNLSSGVFLTNASRLNVTDDGVFALHVNCHFNTSSGNTSAYIFVQKNGVTMPMTAATREFNNSVSGSITLTEQIALSAGDYIEIAADVDNTSLSLTAEADDGVHGGVPSVYASLSFVSNG